MSSQLLRQLGIVSATALVVSNMIGTGIFTTTGFLAGQLGSVPLVLAIWVVGAVVALLGAVCYSELGVNFPSSGGEYVYLTQAYGPTWGFLTGWVSFFAGFSAPIAAAALGLSGCAGMGDSAFSQAFVPILAEFKNQQGHDATKALVDAMSARDLKKALETLADVSTSGVRSQAPVEPSSSYSVARVKREFENKTPGQRLRAVLFVAWKQAHHLPPVGKPIELVVADHLNKADVAAARAREWIDRDGVDVVAEAGAKAIIQPGGSIRDEEVVAAADEHGIAMVYTGVRHFRH